MKTFFKNLLYLHLWLLVKILLWVKKPYIILVLGNEQKRLIKEKLINLVSQLGLDTTKQIKPYNTVFGITLTILNLPSGYSNIFKWIGIYFYSGIKFFRNLISYPQFLILEGGIDELHESNGFLNLFHPEMIVFTNIAHTLTDDYSKIDILEKEFLKFVNYLNEYSKGLVSLNISNGNIEDITKLIQQKEKKIGIILGNNEKVKKLGDKLIRKIFISSI